ncbi:MAG: hypothetical protein HY088_06775 [Ignavibacteriales bacterium]|nr:hypothetical protein [Ignavibacteriales bacterium]
MNQPAQSVPIIESQSHKFSLAEQDIIYYLSHRMKFVGIFNLISVGILGFSGLFMLFVKPLIGIIYLLCVIPGVFIGIWTIDASNSFKMIIDLSGAEIIDLMSALGSLRKLYNLQFWIIVVALGFCALAIVIGVLFIVLARV